MIRKKIMEQREELRSRMAEVEKEQERLDEIEEQLKTEEERLDEIQKKDFGIVDTQVIAYLTRCAEMIDKNNYEDLPTLINEASRLHNALTQLKKEELKRIQGQSGSTKVSMVYLNMLQETTNVVNFSCNLIKVSKKFQME